MAKRKSTASAKPRTNAKPKRSSSASQDGAPSAAASTSRTGAPRTISGPEIGRVAGEIWALLSDNGEQTLAAVKKSVNASPDVALAAIGWLAREDKLEFTTSGRTVKVSLR